MILSHLINHCLNNYSLLKQLIITVTINTVKRDPSKARTNPFKILDKI